MDINKDKDDFKFNKEAKAYVPKKKTPQKEKKTEKSKSKEKENKQTQPKEEYQAGNLEDEEDPENVDAEFEDIMNDIIRNEHIGEIENAIDEEESDEEKWFPKYRNCKCCKGLIYKCSGEICKNLGVCYCKAKEDCDEEDEK